MDMMIYHGSENIIPVPVYGKGNRRNDYGKGFYCTENRELAKEWACGRMTDGFVNSYSLKISDDLQILYLNKEPFTILHWLALLAEHRTYWQNGSIAQKAKDYLRQNFLIDVSTYDLVIGYRADDSYFSFAQDFVSGTISLRKLREAMTLGHLGEQIMVRSEKAFSLLDFTGAEPARAGIYYVKKHERDRTARLKYRSLRNDGDNPDDIFMLDILREEIKADDPRLR